ncbi:MAG: A/G-specific adenine glycosylase [Fimbriimonadaceae bacterium]
MTEFQSALLDWYVANRREMPWRKELHGDPYAVWVSEAMLQQTTVAAVVPFFERWMERFPSVEALASASEDEVLQYWQGLGYYSRARNLLAGAKKVVENGWPESVEGWRLMPGVGEYTAGAVSSIAQGIAAPVVDGNVERVFSRIAMDSSVGSELKKGAWRWAKSVLVEERAGDWNQALMELGAMVCSPRNPACGICPISEFCSAFREGRVGEFPAPKLKKQWVELQHVTVVAVLGESVGLVQAGSGEWWSGLWHPPRGASLEDLEIDGGRRVGEFKHVVTRHKITLEVRRLELDDAIDGLEFVPLAEINDWAISAPGRRAIGLAVDRGLVLPGLG